jgi:hypothetical protein
MGSGALALVGRVPMDRLHGVTPVRPASAGQPAVSLSSRWSADSCPARSSDPRPGGERLPHLAAQQSVGTQRPG